MRSKYLKTKESAAVICLGLILPVIAGAGCTKTSADPKLPDPEVLVAHPVQQDVAVHNQWVATLDGYVNADIRPQVSGYIIGQNYKEGTRRPQRPGPVRNRSAAVPGGPEPRHGPVGAG